MEQNRVPATENDIADGYQAAARGPSGAAHSFPERPQAAGWLFSEKFEECKNSKIDIASAGGFTDTGGEKAQPVLASVDGIDTQ